MTSLRGLWRGCFLLALLFLMGPETLLWAGQANIFVYHRFGDGRFPATNTSLEDFEGHLEILRREKVAVLALGEVVRRLRSGIPLPERCAVLTVDDGYDTFLTGAMPLLRRYGYPATLFVSTAFVGHKGYLDWSQLKALLSEGIEIGNHSHHHDYLVERREAESAAEWLKRIGADIVTAQERFRKNLGFEPLLFSYPFGEYTPEIPVLLRKLGFAGGVVQHSGVAAETSDPFLLPRFPMGAQYGKVGEFRAKLKMRPLPVTVIAPAGPLSGDDDPFLLTVEISPGHVDISRLRCYVNGCHVAAIRPVPGFPGRMEVRAEGVPLSRRTQYVLTAPSRQGEGWYWFSHLRIKRRM